MNVKQDDGAAQRQRILDAPKAARLEARNYRHLTQTPAHFLYDGKAEAIRADMLVNTRIFPDRFAMIKALIRGGSRNRRAAWRICPRHT